MSELRNCFPVGLCECGVPFAVRRVRSAFKVSCDLLRFVFFVRYCTYGLLSALIDPGVVGWPTCLTT